MINKIIYQLKPPIIDLLFTKEGLSRLWGFCALKVYGLFKGVSINKIFHDELIKTIQENPEIEQLFPEQKFKKHYVYYNMRNTIEFPDLYITQLRYYRMYQFFKKNYPDMFEADTKILDVGDSSGLFLGAMGKKGTSLNLNQECVEHIKKNGVEAVLGNAEKLPLEDNSYDYCFSFQCIEHLLNPLAALKELGRVARKKVFISIPYTRRTKIYDLQYGINLYKNSWKQDVVKDGDCHVFEFSKTDLKKLLSFVNLDYETSFPLLYLDGNTFKRQLLNFRFGSYFNFFVLKPKK